MGAQHRTVLTQRRTQQGEQRRKFIAPSLPIRVDQADDDTAYTAPGQSRAHCAAHSRAKKLASLVLDFQLAPGSRFSAGCVLSAVGCTLSNALTG